MGLPDFKEPLRALELAAATVEKFRVVARHRFIEPVGTGEAGEFGPATKPAKNPLCHARLGEDEIDSRQPVGLGETFGVRHQYIFTRQRQPLGKNRGEEKIDVETATSAEDSPCDRAGPRAFGSFGDGITDDLKTVLFEQRGDQFQVEAIPKSSDRRDDVDGPAHRALSTTRIFSTSTEVSCVTQVV